MQPIPYVKSCSIGYWVRRGSCHEGVSEEGLAHFLEHTVFKGTERYPSPEVIAEVSDYLGGHVDAFTGKESACFYGKVLRERLPDLVALLTDLVTAPKFDPDELARERDVVLEEINQSEDQPDDWASELFYQNFWLDRPLGHSILGRPEQLCRYTPEDVGAFFSKTYRPRHLLIVAAGDLDVNEFAQLAESGLEGRFGSPVPGGVAESGPNPSRAFINNLQRPNLNQTSMVIGFPGPCHSHGDRVPAALMCHVLGGGMSSRLFQELREKRGLCYQIGSFTSHYSDSGAVQVAASCAANKTRDLVQRAMAECRRLACDGPTQAELDRAKLQLKTSLVFSQESTGSRMFSIAHQAMHLDSIMDVDQQLSEIDSATLEQVGRAARDILVPGLAGVSAVGTKKGREIRPSDLE